MVKNILSVLIFLFSIFFVYFVVSSYFSDNQKIKIKKKREAIINNLKNNKNELPFLVNDTNDIVNFNTSFENENDIIKRSFWKLFKKND
jgi:hypothetical protein